MTDGEAQMTEERLLEALDAWNKQDVELIISYFSDDATYHASFGPEPYGRSFSGKEKVREGVEAFVSAYPGGYFAETEVTVSGDHGSAEWVFVATNEDGEEVRIRGCDLLEFDGDLISTKNAFRKADGKEA
jgi:ketosteroid isomerase-like protein